MGFFIIGVSHHQAPVAVREKFVGRDQTEELLYERLRGRVEETVVLSTCNRLEVLAVAENLDEGRRAVREALGFISGLAEEEFCSYLYEPAGLAACRHLFRVASSLDSLVVGEPQILGQVKEAFRRSLDLRRTGPLINKLMHKCFRAAKRVRSETSLAGGAVSVAGAAVALARRLDEDGLGNRSALVLGAGPMAALALANLAKKSPARLTVMNRTEAKARLLAAKHQTLSRPWGELETALAETDLVIAATGAPEPVLTQSLVGPAMTRRPERPLTVIDIGVPRNAAHDLKHLPGVRLKNIDDLNEVVWENRAARQKASEKAEAIIDEEVAKFDHWLKSLASRPTVTALTRKAEAIRRRELDRTLSQHHFSPDQAAALEVMTGALVRRLLHDPLAFIKSSAASAPEKCLTAADCRPRCLASLRRAFNLESEGDR